MSPVAIARRALAGHRRRAPMPAPAFSPPPAVRVALWLGVVAAAFAAGTFAWGLCLLSLEWGPWGLLVGGVVGVGVYGRLDRMYGRWVR